MEIPNYRKLIVWQKAHQNALSVLDLFSHSAFSFSKITNQCLGASTSIGANIAEGNSAITLREKKRYLKIALNSSYEFDNWLQILKDSKRVDLDKEYIEKIEERNIEVIKILSHWVSHLSS